MNKKTAIMMLSALGAGPGMAAAADKQPNIVLILLDDVGYSDLGCYGSEIPTPNIDALAENGVRMRNFYNMARSAPTRCSLMTGLYAHQAGCGALNKVPGYEHYQGYANETNAFIPEVLRSAGYFNIMTGKWHIGMFLGATPIRRGFDRSLNAPVGGFYFSDDKPSAEQEKDEKKRWIFRNDEKLRFDDPSLPEKWYSTDLWTDEGLKYVDEAVGQDKPFFWYLAMNSAHFPLQAPAETIAKYRGKYAAGWDEVRNERYKRQVEMGLFDRNMLTPRNPKVMDWEEMTPEDRERQDLIMAIYAAVIEETDKNIGKVISHLKEIGEYDNTLFIVLSDNGGNAEGGIYGKCNGRKPGQAGSTVFLGTAWADVANTPYFLYKHHGHEGGCNTPLIMSWGDGIPEDVKGSIDKYNYGHITDIMATLVELTGATYPKRRDGNMVPKMEGQSLLPILKGNALPEDRVVIVEHEGNKMLRRGDFKIVQENKEAEWRMYNIRKDPTELRNVRDKHEQHLQFMIDLYNKEATRTFVEPEIEFPVGIWYTPVQNYPGISR
ncbi:MAG: arylsulfatase [Bacteroidales bacterium]|nr:arylsulfatase [Bacteroidales bacterium]